jgi:hypothetical protein
MLKINQIYKTKLYVIEVELMGFKFLVFLTA